MKPRLIALAAGVSCLLFAAAARPRDAGQASAGPVQPRFLNAKLEQRPAGGGLAAAFGAAVRASQSPTWIAYSVPATPGDHGLCDADRPQRIYLEGRPQRAPVQDQASPVPDIVVLFRAEGSKVQRLRVTSVNCEVDAGGLPVAWLTGATAVESVALLRGVVRDANVAANLPVRPGETEASYLRGGTVREETAVMAIALHGDPAAGRALEEFAAPGQPTSLRKRAVFWLGVGRGAVDTLVRLARGDESLDVRKEAMFWLSRSQDPRAIAFTEEVLKK